MTRYAQAVSKRKTPQTEKADVAQVKNNASGFSFPIDTWSRLERFLILGAEGGTYYVNERMLVKQNYESLEACLNENGDRTIKTIVDVSQGGRAPKNEPAIFALAVASGHPNPEVRKAALEAMPEVCRIGTHLFDFLTSAQEFRGWGRAMRKAIAAWYTTKDGHKLGYQVAKYRQRNGWSHRDVLRKCGGAIEPGDDVQQAVFRWVVAGMDGMGARKVKRGDKVDSYPALDPEKLPRIIQGYEACKAAESAKKAALIVSDYRLTHEMVPSEFLKSREVWDALLQNMPLGALVRNLGRLTALGCLEPFSDGQKKAVAMLTDPVAVKKARLHPVAALKALKQYRSGSGGLGKLTWDTNKKVASALEKTFYLGFDAIEPTGKNIIVALDVSGSMGGGWGGGIKGMNLSAREAAAAMAMVTVRTEENHHIQAFAHKLQPLDITENDSLDTVVKKTSGLPFGGTDCALPMVFAKDAKLPVDAFYIYTDNETWYGNIHPHQALNEYRQKMGRDAKLAVVGMTSTGFSIANPNDPGMLDVVGFDTSAPSVMADFIRQGFGG